MKSGNLSTKINSNIGSIYGQNYKLLILFILALAWSIPTLQAQETRYTRPAWNFGVAAGANLNFYQGTTQQLTTGFLAPVGFREGSGVGLYLAPTLEYHRPGSLFGFMLQAGFDSRKGAFEQVFICSHEVPADLSTNLAYLSFEPSIRFTPFRSNFYIYGGPRLGYNIDKSFTYQQQANPSFPDQSVPPEFNDDFSSINNTIISMQIGAGLDIPISSQRNQTQLTFSPFVAVHPYFGQNPRSTETWTLTTVRLGAALKIGSGKAIQPAVMPVGVVAPVIVPEVEFMVYSPENIPVTRRVRETFPLSNNVFFEAGSTVIPDRYVLLSKDQVNEFKEDQLEAFVPVRLSGRSDRQMIVYYNVLNILGDRMGKNPSARVTLSGSSAQGESEALAMAESVKNYLVEIFGITPSRIETEGRLKPRIPSERPGGSGEFALLREEDNRVSIMSQSPALMMEFQTGPEALLKPVEFVDIQEAPLDSYVRFTVDGADEAFSSWLLEIRDERGVLQNFGPYTQEHVSIPGKSILGNRSAGDYKATMVGTTKDGQTIRREVPVKMALWAPPERAEGFRYSLVFGFDQSEAIDVYKKYLTDIVAPKIPRNGTVIIHGHTDNIGPDNHNLALSRARAVGARRILENALSQAGRRDVKFEVYGFGEDQNLAPFSNTTPEERFYNRTVIIDIIPTQ